MQYRGLITMWRSILCTVLVDSIIKFFFDINLTSMSSNISFSHFFISLVVGRFWHLRFEQGLKSRRIIGFLNWQYWKVVIFFFLRTLACTLYWTLGLLLGLWLKFLKLNTKTCRSERTWIQNFINQQLGKRKRRIITKRSKLNLVPMVGCIS